MDIYAQRQLSILEKKSALFKIQPHTRLLVFLVSLLLGGFGVYYAQSVGLVLFTVGFLNYILLLSFRIHTHVFSKPRPPISSPCYQSTAWPTFSVIIPLKEEDEVIHATLQAIDALAYPSSLKQVIIVVEDTNSITQQSLSTTVLPANFQVLSIPTAPPFTKARALMYALQKATGQYITVYDAESRPEPSQLKKAAEALINTTEQTCFQAKIKISNQHQNWITRHFAGEYDEWYERHLSELSARDLPFGLGGNSFFISKKALEQAGAWAPFNVTEDADMSVRLAENGVQLRILDSITTETCPETPKNWINQRTRWNKGLFITQLVHAQRTLGNKHFKGERWLSFWLPMIAAALVPFFNLYLPFYMTFGQLSYPFMVVLSSILWVLFGLNLLCSLFMSFLTYKRLSIHRNTFGILADGLAYLFLQIIAGFKAYIEYFIAPMYWHKTKHVEQATPEGQAMPFETQFSLT